MTIKNQFEIISRNENYAFNHNKNFCCNGNNRICSSLRRSETTEVIQSVWIATPHAVCLRHRLAMTKVKTDYFLAMIMAEILFLVFGVILISAFYLIEKLIQKKF